MSQTITEYRCKLINKILFARSQEEVRRIIDAAVRGLREHRLNGHQKGFSAYIIAPGNYSICHWAIDWQFSKAYGRPLR